MDIKYLSVTYFHTLALLLNNKTIIEVAKERDLEVETIIKHILNINSQYSILQNISLNHMDKCPKSCVKNDDEMLEKLYKTNMYAICKSYSYKCILVLLNKTGYLKEKMQWQDDYFVVSVGQSQVESISSYIKNQEEHHHKKSFSQEVDEFMKKYG